MGSITCVLIVPTLHANGELSTQVTLKAPFDVRICEGSRRNEVGSGVEPFCAGA